MRCLTLVAAVLLAASPAALFAQESTHVGEVYSDGAWTVNIYQDEDGALSCISEVSSELATLAIWAYESGEIYVNVASDNWGFDPAAETFEIEIDESGSWSLDNPDINDGSVFVELADNEESVKFLTEVAGGKIAYLRNPAGELLAEPFSLEGSQNSMLAMSGCIDGLTTTE